jgi:vitamin B12 transporter
MRRAFRLSLALGSASTVATAPAAAQDVRDTFRLEELVVTPTRLPTPRQAVPVSVTVLQGDDLRARGVHQVLDALREVLGAAVVQVGGTGAITSLFLRGGESDYVSVLLDGVPLNQAGGAMDLAALGTENLERIEIVRGPASVLYGSDAMTGVVHLISRTGNGRPLVQAGVRLGGFRTQPPLTATGPVATSLSQTVELDARVQGGTGGVQYGLSTTRTLSDGLYTSDGVAAFDNRYGNAAVSGVLRLAPDSLTDAALTFRYADSDYHYPTDGAGQFVDHNAVSRVAGTALGLEIGRFVHPRLEARLLLATHAGRGNGDDPPDGPADTLGVIASESHSVTERRRVELRSNLHLGGGAVVTVGAQLEQERERGFSSFTSAFGGTETTSSFDTDLERATRGYYAQVQLVAARLGANAGARIEDNEAFGAVVTYRAGVTYGWPWGLRVRAAAGTGFKEPSFFENFATGVVRGNPDLDPERSVSIEGGADLSLVRGRLSIGATAFAQRFRDLIDFTFSPPSPTAPNYFNIVGANASGLEVEGRATLVEGWTLRVGYAHLRTSVTQAGFDEGPGSQFAPGERLLRRPAHTGVATFGGRVSPDVNLHGQLRYVGTRRDLDFAAFPADPQMLSPCAVVDAGAELTLGPWAGTGVTTSIRVENVLDARVRESFNFPSRGRTVWVGIQVRN